MARGMAKLGYLKEADRFENCRDRLLMFRCRDEGRQFAVVETCKSRICPECQKVVRQTYFRQWYRYICRMPKVGGKQLMLLTLTVRCSGQVDDVQIKRRFHQVREFLELVYGTRADRKQKIKRHSMKQNGNGAIAVAEVGQRWNLHFHLLVYGPRVPQAQLAQLWRDVTGDSYVVDIRRVGKLRGGVWEVLKYMAKVPFADGVAEYVQYLSVLKGTRRVHTFGTFYNAVKIAKSAEYKRCPFCGARLLADGLAYNWQGQARLYWWMDKFKRKGGDLRSGADPPVDIPAAEFVIAEDLVGYPTCMDRTGALPDAYFGGFFHGQQQKTA